MRHAVPLSEFMPYGAPELLESRQRDMSRALVVTSAAALVLYALTGGLASLLPAPTVIPSQTVFVIEPWVIPQQRVEVKPPAPAPRVKPAPVVHEAAKPIPVSDDVAPPSDIPVASDLKAGDSGTGEVIAPTEVGTVGPIIEKLPALGEWVYVEREPAAIVEVKPEYPRMAWEAGIEGRVTVHVLIGKEGRVIDAVLAKNIQVPMLNEAALEAARKWRFTPGIANGHPVPCWTAIPFNFRLH